MRARTNASSNRRLRALPRYRMARSCQARPWARRRTISSTIPEASASASRNLTISTRSPSFRRVNSVLPSRVRSQEMTAFAACRMWPVLRKFSSRRTIGAPGKSRWNCRMKVTSAPRQPFMWNASSSDPDGSARPARVAFRPSAFGSRLQQADVRPWRVLADRRPAGLEQARPKSCRSHDLSR